MHVPDHALTCKCTCTMYMGSHVHVHAQHIPASHPVSQPPPPAENRGNACQRYSIHVHVHEFLYTRQKTFTGFFGCVHLTWLLIHIHELSCLGSLVVYRVLCLECRVSWVQVPPRQLIFLTALGVLCCFALLFV